MKKSTWLFIVLFLGVLGAAVYLLRAADAKHVQVQDITIELEDGFEK